MKAEKMRAFGEWESGVREYCESVGVDFDFLNSMRKRWGIDFVDIVDESGAVLLTVCRGHDGKPVFEEKRKLS